MARTIAEKRIPARMPTAVYDRLVEAAQAVGATLNQFLVQAALEKANSILEEERKIKLTTASAEAVFALMENPPEPNEYLRNAMRRRDGRIVPVPRHQLWAWTAETKATITESLADPRPPKVIETAEQAAGVAARWSHED